MLLPSANDAANALAEHIGGSIAGFAELMNEKAEEIGCQNSHFANPSGIHDEELYSTAYDMSLIARYAMNIDTFREIVQTTSYTLPSTEAYPNTDRKFTSSNLLLIDDNKDYYYEYATGVKTGYTASAKDCLLASAKKDDVEFVIVVLGSGLVNGSHKAKYLDCKTLFDFAFDNYTAYYKNLQEENAKTQTSSEEEINSYIVSSDNSSSSFYKIISKAIAVIAIVLALKLLFETKKKKKKNHYKYGSRKKKTRYKAKH